MAQWNRTDRTLYAKLVYYGTALGGKTTNLKVLHRLTDPDGKERLVSVETADDRTLFFDLLPFDLGSVLGYKVAIKLYTVPGQVRYEATRRVVLAGADAVVFVADSDPARVADNRAAWDDLRRNMKANRLDPATVPVLVQLNKRDLPHAVPVAAMERDLGLPAGRAYPAVAFRGPGVAETFVAACRAMLERLLAMAEPATRKSLEAGDLAAHVERAFAPVLARVPALRLDVEGGDGSALVVERDDLLESAVATGVALGGELADAHGRASRLAVEAEALRRLSDALRRTGASFDRRDVVDAAVQAARQTLGAAAAALLTADPAGRPRVEAGAGRDLGPLLADADGARLVGKMFACDTPAIVDDLAAELGAPRPAAAGFHALVVVPVETRPRTALVAAMPAPDGTADDADVRFLGTLAAHLAVGLDKVRMHDELRRHRDRLEAAVVDRTRELRKAYDDLKAADAMKDRFLSNVSHEMRSPLTVIIGAATVLKDCDAAKEDRVEMAASILHAGDALRLLLDGLIRVASLEEAGPVQAEDTPPAEVVAEALRLSARDGVRVTIDPRVASLPVDAALLARAVSNLVDNAFKFSPEGSPVELRIAPCMLARAGAGIPGVAIAVLDRGPGVPDDEAERVFVAFEQGGDPLTGKPRGVGLGLHEARTIARRHGGTLIHLPRPGGGSEFRISLPAEPAVRAVPREAARA